MAEAIYLSTLGVKIGYGVETTSGKKPDDFFYVKGAKSIPDYNPEPETIDVTPLDEEGYRRYVQGLQDVGGSLAFTYNLTEWLIDNWDGKIVPAYETAEKAGLRMWWEIYIPKISKGFFFVGNPTKLGLPAMGVSEALETDVYITPTETIGWDTRVELTEMP